jgi:hypothetical protein
MTVMVRVLDDGQSFLKSGLKDSWFLYPVWPHQLNGRFITKVSEYRTYLLSLTEPGHDVYLKPIYGHDTNTLDTGRLHDVKP